HTLPLHDALPIWNSEAYEHVCAPIAHKGWKGRLGHGRGPGITSAQHPLCTAPKIGARFVPACDYRDRFTQPPHRATEARRQGRGYGSPILVPGNVTVRPHQGTTTQATTTGPRSSVDRAGAF